MGSDQIVDRMGFSANQLILEVGLKDDCDQDLRAAITSKVGSDFISNNASDLVDELVDALTFLSEAGPVWVLTPKVGRPGHVEASDIQDAAPTAGLTQTVSLPVGSNWTATKLVHRKGNKK